MSTTSAVERGGPFGRGRDWGRTRFARKRAAQRAHMRAIGSDAAPATESSPFGSVRWRMPRRGLAILLLVVAIAGAVLFGNGAYLYAKAALGQWLLHRAWAQTLATGDPVKPWPWADTHPVARLTAPAVDADVLVLAGASGGTLAWGPRHLDDSAPPGAPGNTV